MATFLHSRGVAQFRHLRRLAIGVGLTALSTLQARAGKNSPPAQVMMVATMPATFSVQAAPAMVTGAVGGVQSQGGSRGHLFIRGQLRGQGGRAVVRIPVCLAANTRSFVVRAEMESGVAPGSVFLTAPGLMSRPMPVRKQAPLAMGMARDHGREFFSLDHPLPATLEIVFQNLPSGQPRNFTLTLAVRDLGY